VEDRCLPAAQSMHEVVPNCDAYFPALHATQSASPSLAVCLPEGQTAANQCQRVSVIACR